MSQHQSPSRNTQLFNCVFMNCPIDVFPTPIGPPIKYSFFLLLFIIKFRPFSFAGVTGHYRVLFPLQLPVFQSYCVFQISPDILRSERQRFRMYVPVSRWFQTDSRRTQMCLLQKETSAGLRPAAGASLLCGDNILRNPSDRLHDICHIFIRLLPVMCLPLTFRQLHIRKHSLK